MIKDIKAAIFDADGTLLDSMWYCNDISTRYLESLNVSNIEKDLSEKMFSLSFEEGAKYLCENYLPDRSKDEIKREILKSLEDFYFNKVNLKDGVIELLDFLKRRNIKMIIATSSDEYLIRRAIERLGISKYFIDILSPDNTGMTKKQVDFFDLCLEKLDTKCNETYLFEDGLYSIKIANSLCISTVAVKDMTNEKYEISLKENANIYLEKISDFKKFFRKVALTIAGSDSSGGAGIQADIKTMLINGVYAESVITSLTAQNTLGISMIENVSEKFLKKELEAVFSDIYPDAVKIGMVSSCEFIEIISFYLRKYEVKNIVLDPIIASTSGTILLSQELLEVLFKKLFPISTLITPNIIEAGIICSTEIKSREDMLDAARDMNNRFKTNILIKGGHLKDSADDLLYSKSNIKWFYKEKLKTKNSHGTGCTLSSAIASNLAKGYSLEKSIEFAKKYLSLALESGLNLGSGNGPLDHGYFIEVE